MDRRLVSHPVLEVPKRETAVFTWNGRPLSGYAGEMITSALAAAGIDCLGRHPKDHSPQGLFCANGQCSACLVTVDGVPVKGCMTPLRAGMAIASVDGVPTLPPDDSPVAAGRPEIVHTDVLVIGGGPAGLAAAVELGVAGIPTLLVDDKHALGGKLVLQTHKFFGSQEDSYAGTRGYEIGRLLAQRLSDMPSVRTWLDTTVVAVYADGLVGAVTGSGAEGLYRLVRPQRLLVATGARERMLSFAGNTLPGILGAGAFQTLVNRDLVACSQRILVVGAGNVGLIAAYHALQAGMEVAAVVEALPEVGGYRVHADKLRRLGVPILTGHTILSAEGSTRVERATIAALDEGGNAAPGSEQTLAVDTVLIAVGLSKADEFYGKAIEAGIGAYRAGDAAEIAEASAAMIDGRITAGKITAELGYTVESVPSKWLGNLVTLRSGPGAVRPAAAPPKSAPVEPVFHCLQEIPCNPCVSVCPEGAIATQGNELTGIPYLTQPDACRACLACIRICPGLAITLVDSRKDAEFPTVTFPFELPVSSVVPGKDILVLDQEGAELGRFRVVRVLAPTRTYPATSLVQVQIPRVLARRAAGVRPDDKPTVEHGGQAAGELPAARSGLLQAPPALVCRCERVSEDEIRAAIRSGVHDLNQLKALTRAGMGACGGKTCRPQLERLLREEGVPENTIVPLTQRPLFVEVPFAVFARGAAVKPEGCEPPRGAEQP